MTGRVAASAPDDELEAARAAQRSGRLAEARQLYRRVLDRHPDEPAVLVTLAALARQEGDNAEAVALLERAQSLPGSDAASLAFNLGNALRDLGRRQAAETTWRRLLSDLEPDHRGALTNLGLLLKDSRRSAEALDLLGRVVGLEPQSAPAWLNYGLALLEADRPEAAATAFEKSLALSPGNARARSHLALTLKRLGRLDEAFAVLAPALAAGAPPADAGTLTAYANLLTVAGQEGAALRLFDRVLAADPGDAEAQLGRASALLRLGRYGPGFAAFEARFAGKVARQKWPGRPWRGEEDPAARLLVTPEQGLGDVIQYLRLLPLARARVGRLTLAVPAPLMALCQGLAGCDETIAQQEAPGLAEVDWHCPLPSLPLALGLKHPGEVPPTPYLPLARQPRQDPRAVVAFAWSGNPGNPIDRLRSLEARDLAPLFSLPRLRCVSLQVGPPAEQLRQQGFEHLVEDWSREIGDFADTARLLGKVDLVVSADTAMAHLAGALGLPVLLLGCLGSDWRWRATHAGRNAWYPATEIVWRRGNEPWVETVKRARPLLAAMLAR